jgi:hypothetical protein
VIEETEFRSLLSLARRVIDVYGEDDASDLSRISYTHGEVSISSKREVVDIFFRGSLVFRHDPNGEMTDFFETRGAWIDEVERMARDIPPSASGIASRRQ